MAKHLKTSKIAFQNNYQRNIILIKEKDLSANEINNYLINSYVIQKRRNKLHCMFLHQESNEI